MASEDKAKGGPELPAGQFTITPEHLAQPGNDPTPMHGATGDMGEVGATSQTVAAGFGAGSERLGAGLADIGRDKREKADPALQRGEQHKPAA